MSLEVALALLGLVLAILAAVPPLRNYYLLNIAIVCIAIAIVLNLGAVKV